MSRKKKQKAVDDGWTSLQGDFSLDDLRAAARSQQPIEKLSITKTTCFTHRKAAALRGMRAQWLWLWCDVTKAALRHVLSIEGLRTLDVLQIDARGAMPSFARAATLEAFRCPMRLQTRDIQTVLEAPALQEFATQSSTLDMPLVRAMAAQPTLRKLDIEATNFDDDMAEVIASHHAIERLDIGGTRITARGLGHICRMRQLASLDLWETNIGIDDLRMLTALERLEYLSLGKVPEGNKTTDGLRVEGNPSHDAQAVVDLILRMPSLKRVWLDGLNLTSEQRRALQSHLESLRN